MTTAHLNLCDVVIQAQEHHHLGVLWAFFGFIIKDSLKQKIWVFWSINWDKFQLLVLNIDQIRQRHLAHLTIELLPIEASGTSVSFLLNFAANPILKALNMDIFTSTFTITRIDKNFGTIILIHQADSALSLNVRLRIAILNIEWEGDLLWLWQVV